MARLKLLTFRVDEADAEAIQEAMVLRKSGLFRRGGELGLPESESDLAGAVLAEICREWNDALTFDAEPVHVSPVAPPKPYAMPAVEPFQSSPEEEDAP